jgi:SAM-dependent methyltransferase/uncharacterized protein YbaR (Trm112 family)
MKSRLLEFLVCPACKGQLNLEIFEDSYTFDFREILSGLMTCRCGEWYPIIKGVPRMLRSELKKTLFEDYREFFQQFHTLLPPLKSDLISNNSDHIEKKQRTAYSFGYEWTEFSEYNSENFREWLAGSPPDSFFSGKFGLEAGCGAGRHTKTAVNLGAEICAVDLSKAVDVAFQKNRNSPRAHIIQADIYDLPFRKGIFDFVYCLGVIQHLPDPPAGFSILSTYVQPGGFFFINVYAKGRISWPLLKAMRLITTRLPNRLTKTLSFGFTLLDYTMIFPYKLLKRIEVFKNLLDHLVFERIKAYAELDFQTSYADWFDRLAAPLDIRYGKEDVLNWYYNAGFENIIVMPLRNAFWNGVGRKPFQPD